MLQVGIVGLPNVGKSTLFKTLTKKQVDCANFPFCTIEPNVGVVEVADERLHKLAKISHSAKIVPAAIEFVDIAGLVKGAHKGEGLGNKFLGNIREVDMILHVVRAFEDPNIVHVDAAIDPLRDAEIIETELAMADLETVSKRLDNVRAHMKAGRAKDLEKEENALVKINALLEQGKMANLAELDEDEEKIVRGLQLLTRKPILYILNVDEKTASDSNWPSPLGASRPAMALSVKVESEIAEMPPEDQTSFLKELGLNESGLDRVIKTCYRMLGLITYFTSGETESRAWTIKIGTKAPQAAGVIHTDFEKGFIRAEVIKYSDFIDFNGEFGCREAGKIGVQGKEYVMEDGDVCHFRFNV